MELENSGNHGEIPNEGGNIHREDTDEIDSSCSTPYYSAPSSPGRGSNSSNLAGYYYSAPSSPMHFVLSSFQAKCSYDSAEDFNSCDFEFSARFTNPGGVPVLGSMSSADELFLNGQIRPMKLSSHLQRQQVLEPLVDLDEEKRKEEECVGEMVRGRDLRLRSRSQHRRARSLSPLRNPGFEWRDDNDGVVKSNGGKCSGKGIDLEVGESVKENDDMQTAAVSVSASSSRSNSSSSGRNGKRWIFLKDFLLYRSKSEGRGNGKEKFWQSISFSPSKEKLFSSSSSAFFSNKDKSKCHSSSSTSEQKKHKKQKKPDETTTTSGATGSKTTASPTAPSAVPKPKNGVGKRRMPVPSAHERLYTTNRAQAEEMRKRTFLPYRQGLLGCLGFSSRSYGAMNGLARTLNTVSSR